jgi:hypothetical protein
LTGTTTGDNIGNDGVVVLSNGNYVVRSSLWDNGAAVDAGAVTWGNGTTGTTGAVTSANSLVGTNSGDNIGGVTVLSNGNYVVRSLVWDNGAAVDAGAVTWGSGTTGTTGAVTSANSLVGTTTGDNIGNYDVFVLSNGNYVVRSSLWDNGAAVDAGAVTWGNGTTGIKGVVTGANSLVGTASRDYIGIYGVFELSNGNYVVSSSIWDNGAAVDAGAVTWGNGTTGISGPITSSNSLVGTTSGDNIGTDQTGSYGVAVLSNGNYVVRSALWDNGAAVDAGAVTWGNGTTGIKGAVTRFNSLVGTSGGGGIGDGSVLVLANSNYVVTSPLWSNGFAYEAGAVTWGNGSIGTTGEVSSANSLVGTSTGDRIGNYQVAALSNGNYVVASPNWDNGGATDAGAVTWGNGTTGISGPITSANSLVGTTSHGVSGNQRLGISSVFSLPNGNFVVTNPLWDNGAATEAGAVTWGNGTTGISGAITSANSLVGTNSGDHIGGVAVLSNGNYVVASPDWDNVAAVDAGAVTWGNGTTGISGAVSSSNSLAGTTTDRIGSDGVVALSNGNYVVRSSFWDSVAAVDAGAVTWGNGTTGIKGAITPANSLVGTTGNDHIGGGAFVHVVASSDGSYIVFSALWDNGSVVDAGAVTYGPGTGVTGVITPANSVIGTSPGSLESIVHGRTTAGAYVIATTQDRVLLLSTTERSWFRQSQWPRQSLCRCRRDVLLIPVLPVPRSMASSRPVVCGLWAQRLRSPSRVVAECRLLRKPRH